jgi:ferrous iron transport protein B
MLLYLIGFAMAILAALVLNKTLKIKSKSYFVIEMPNYRLPLIKNVLFQIVDKTKAFVFGAGKIILAISVLLWVLASYGPTNNFSDAEKLMKQEYSNLDENELNAKVAAYKLESSYIGILGKGIEPIIKPLGYDWKIGIALLTSFAAREVFVGTLATIYSVGSEEELSIKNKMQNERHSISGKPVYTLASGISLLLFYAFAMQCMSTLAIVKRETNGWKWPMLQLVSMTVLAYVAALVAFQFLK